MRLCRRSSRTSPRWGPGRSRGARRPPPPSGRGPPRTAPACPGGRPRRPVALAGSAGRGPRPPASRTRPARRAGRGPAWPGVFSGGLHRPPAVVGGVHRPRLPCGQQVAEDGGQLAVGVGPRRGRRVLQDRTCRARAPRRTAPTWAPAGPAVQAVAGLDLGPHVAGVAGAAVVHGGHDPHHLEPGVGEQPDVLDGLEQLAHARGG